RHARHDGGRGTPHGREHDHVPARAQGGGRRHRLHADVVVGHLEAVQRHAPPAFVLRAQPAVQEGEAGGAQRVGLDGGGGGGGARGGGVWRGGGGPGAWPWSPSSEAPRPPPPALPPLMRNVPRANFAPPASNGSSAASKAASLSR